MSLDKKLDFISGAALVAALLLLHVATPYLENMIDGKRFVVEYLAVGVLINASWFFIIYKVRSSYFVGEEKRASAILAQAFAIYILTLFGAAFYNYQSGKENLYNSKGLLVTKSENVLSHKNYVQIRFNKDSERFKLSNTDWNKLAAGDSLTLIIGRGGCDYEFIYAFLPAISK